MVGQNDRYYDVLPTDIGQLEVRLNHHTSQLQGLAKEAEWVNETIDMKRIVLQRVRRDAEIEAEGPSRASSVKDKAKDDKGKNKVTRSDSSKSAEMGDPCTLIKDIEYRIAAYEMLRVSLWNSIQWQQRELGRVEMLYYAGSVKPKRFGHLEPGKFESTPTDRKWSKES